MSLLFAPSRWEGLHGLATAGVSREICGLPAQPGDEIPPRLDVFAGLIRS